MLRQRARGAAAGCADGRPLTSGAAGAGLCRGQDELPTTCPLPLGSFVYFNKPSCPLLQANCPRRLPLPAPLAARLPSAHPPACAPPAMGYMWVGLRGPREALPVLHALEANLLCSCTCAVAPGPLACVTPAPAQPALVPRCLARCHGAACPFPLPALRKCRALPVQNAGTAKTRFRRQVGTGPQLRQQHAVGDPSS